MCPPVLIPVDYGLLSVPAGLHANMPFFVDMVVRSTSSYGGTPLQFKQGWIDGFLSNHRWCCSVSGSYSPDMFGDIFDPDHLPGCSDYVEYPLPRRTYTREPSWNPVTKKFDWLPIPSSDLSHA